MPIGHPAMSFDALLQARIPHDSQIPSPDDHFAEHMSLCVFSVESATGYLPVVPSSALTGVYPHFSESEPSSFLSSWSPAGSSTIMTQRCDEYFPANDDTELCFSGGPPPCTPTLNLTTPGNHETSQWGSGFCTADTVPVGLAMDQREGVCGHQVGSNQLTWHVPVRGMRPRDSTTVPENDAIVQSEKEVRGPAGATGGQNKMVERLKKGSRHSTTADNSSTREGLSSTAEEPCQSPTVVRVALRTAPRKKKRTKMVAKKGESVREQRARASHNMVEKEYRDRLRKYFEELLVVLPQGGARIEEDEQATGSTLDVNQASSSSAEGQQKKLSKADVLAKACQHIEQLECGARKQRLELDMLKEALKGS